MPITHDGRIGGYERGTDGSMEPYSPVSFKLEVNGETILIYDSNILKLSPDLYEENKNIQIPPEGKDLIFPGIDGPIRLKAVKSIELIGAKTQDKKKEYSN